MALKKHFEQLWIRNLILTAVDGLIYVNIASPLLQMQSCTKSKVGFLLKKYGKF